MLQPVVYVDQAFALNLATDVAWLWCTGSLAGAPLQRWRLLLAGALGAAAATFAYFPVGYQLRAPLVKVAGTALLVWLAYGQAVWQVLLRRLLLALLVGAAMAGAVLALDLTVGSGGDPGPAPAITAVGVALAALGGRLLWQGAAVRRRLAAGLAQLEVTTGLGRVTLPALVDSGNLLRDPVGGALVAVVEADSLAACLPAPVVQAAAAGRPSEAALAAAGGRLVPYTALGGSGLLLAVPCQAVLRLPDQTLRVLPRALVALAPGRLHPGGQYRALVPGGWLEDARGSVGGVAG